MKRYIKSSTDVYEVDVMNIIIDVITPVKSKIAANDFNDLTEYTISPEDKEVYDKIVRDVRNKVENFGYTTPIDIPSTNDDSLSKYYQFIKVYPDISYAVVLNVRVSNHYITYESLRDEIEKVASNQERLIRFGKREAKTLLNIPVEKPVNVGITDEVNFILNGVSNRDVRALDAELNKILLDLEDNYLNNSKFITLKQVKDEKHRRLAALDAQETDKDI